MKPRLPLLAATCAGLLAGCANWSGSSASQPEYMPMQGGPGYGPQGPVSQYNAVPEGPPPPDALANSDAWGATGGGGYTSAGGGTSGAAMGTSQGGAAQSQEAGASGGMSNEPGIGSQSAAGRDSGGASGAAGTASSGAPLDQQSACELQRRVSAARTPEERQALMDQAMPGLAPATQERHLQMMRESCQ